MHHETDDLEPQQFARHYMEDDVPLNDVRKSTLRKSVYIGLALFALIITAGFTLKFPDEVSLPFVLKGEVPERIFRFPYPVYVEEIFATTGQKLLPGDRMIRITSPEIVQLISNYRRAEDALTNYRKHKLRSLADTREIVQLQSRQNSNRQEEIRERQAALDNAWHSNEARLNFELDASTKKLEQNQALYSAKYISALEFKDYETAQIRARNALQTASIEYRRDVAALKEEASRYGLQQVSLSREDDRNVAEATTDSSSLVAALALADHAINNTFGRNEIVAGSLVLKAAEAGILSFVFEGEREVPASATLLKMNNKATGLYAYAVSPPSLIGRLEKGQVAFLKVATFPSYEWGAAQGHIDYLSLTPDEKGGFNVKIPVDDARKLSGRLRPGMDGLVAVQLEERSFFEYFFRNFRKVAAGIRGEE